MSTKNALITTHLVFSFILCLLYNFGIVYKTIYFPRNPFLGTFWLISVILCGLMYRGPDPFIPLTLHIILYSYIIVRYSKSKLREESELSWFSGITHLISLSILINLAIITH